MRFLSGLAFILLLFFAQSCAVAKSETMWVSGAKVDCEAGAGKQQCLQVKRISKQGTSDWEYFYSDIIGFEFEEGFRQRIRVRTQRLADKALPADASAIRYTLVKVLEKLPEASYPDNLTTKPHQNLYDIWYATTMNGQLLERKTSIPRLEINLTQMMVYGNNGCNEYSGKIEQVSAQNLAFGKVTATKKMCTNMQLPSEFMEALNDVVEYRIKGLNLTLLNDDDDEVLTLRKGD